MSRLFAVEDMKEIEYLNSKLCNKKRMERNLSWLCAGE